MPRRASLGRIVDQSTMLLMGSIGALILILALFILFHENANATKGYRLRTLERERTRLLLEEEVLKMRVAEAQAIGHLQEDAKIQAMIPMGKVTYVRADASMALRPALESLHD
jgi:hypothetical protein